MSKQNTTAELGFKGSDVRRLVREIEKLTATRTTTDDLLKFTALYILTEAQLRAPVNFGELRGSEFIQPESVSPSGGVYRFGFSKSYAWVMDKGFEKKVIRAKPGKALYIPITRRGARSGALSGGLRALSGSRRSGGAVLDRDFVLRKSMKTPPLRPYGNPRGPNQYFSGTIQRLAGDPTKLLRKIGEAWMGQMRRQAGTP